MSQEEKQENPQVSEEIQKTEQTQPRPSSMEEELVQLRQQLESKEQENKRLQDKYIRLYAEFENYKKRSARDLEETTRFANERLLKEFLTVVDNLERAIFHTKDHRDSARDFEKILEGLELIHKQCLEVMGKFGVTPFESYLQPFDPSQHQAMAQRESDEHETGTVIEEIQKGYRFHDRVLRPALVVVSKKMDSMTTGTEDKPEDEEASSDQER